MIKENVAYGSNSNALLSEDALVMWIKNGRVTYAKILGWNYGWPTLGTTHSTTIENFQAQYPHRIDFVETP